MVYKVMFSEHRIALNREVQNHPDLIELLQIYNRADELPGILGEISNYLAIVVDEFYDPEGIDQMCKVLTHELRRKREGARIIL